MDLLKEGDSSKDKDDSLNLLTIAQEMNREKDLLKDIMSNILQEIGLFTNYLRLRKGEEINIVFDVEYSEGYLGRTEVDKNGRRKIVLNFGRDELKDGQQYDLSKVRGALLNQEAYNLFSPISSSKDFLNNSLTQLSREFPELGHKIIKYVVRLVEDYRVEYLFKEEYPGSVRNFSDIYTAILDKFAMQYNPNSILHLLFLARMATATEHTKTSDLEHLIPSELKNLYDEFVKDIEETKGKEFDSTEMATRKILEKIKDYVKKSKENNNKAGSKSETKLNNLEKLPKLFGIEGSHKSFGSYAEGMKNTNLPSDIAEALDKAKREQDSQPYNQKFEKFAKTVSSELRSSRPNFRRDSVMGYYSYELRKTLEEYYGGHSLETTKSLLGGRLNERKIMDHLVRREPLIGPNVQLYEIRRSSVRGADLLILADTSGSMDRALETVKGVLSALVETTKGSRSVTTRFFGFPSNSGYLYDIKPDEVNSISTNGGTPLANALEKLQSEMKRAPDRNYLLFILTDGEPDNPEDVRQQLRKMKEAGIDVIAILITKYPEIAKSKFAESRVVCLDPSRDIDMRRFLQELNRELLEAFMDKKIEKQKQKMY